jgi:hypothetical protein
VVVSNHHRRPTQPEDEEAAEVQDAAEEAEDGVTKEGTTATHRSYKDPQLFLKETLTA